MTFCELSKQLRKEKGLSQVKLAEALKVSKACVAMIEIGKNEPTANTLIRYADFFECSTDYLLGREDDLGNVTIKIEKPAPLPQDEQKLLDTYRKLDTFNKMRVSSYADIRLEEQDKPVSTYGKK